MAIPCGGDVQAFIEDISRYCDDHRYNCSECALFDWHSGCCLNKMPCDWDVITIVSNCRHADEYDPTEMH